MLARETTFEYLYSTIRKDSNPMSNPLNCSVMKIATTHNFKSLMEVNKTFSDNATCIDFLERRYWGEDKSGVTCPYCGGHRCKRTTDGRWLCIDCHHKFNVTVGTIFHGTKLPLVKWFLAIYLLCTRKKGVTSITLAQDIEVSQKTSWFLLHNLRKVMEQDDNMRLFFAQCDETYVGGRETNKHARKRTKGTQGRSTKTKTPVFGMIDLFGNAIVKVVPDTSKATIQPIIDKHVIKGGKVWTDEYSSYIGLDKLGFKHEVVKHKSKEFVKGNGVNTNAIEGLWGILKRMIWGTHHFVSRKYLQRYVDEVVFLHNLNGLPIEKRFAAFFERTKQVDMNLIYQRQASKYTEEVELFEKEVYGGYTVNVA